MNCEATNKLGESCRARAMNGSSFCFFHDPGKAWERAAARRAGGANKRAAVLPPDTPDKAVGTAGEIDAMLGQAINEVLRGEIGPKVANTVCYLAATKLKAREMAIAELDGQYWPTGKPDFTTISLVELEQLAEKLRIKQEEALEADLIKGWLKNHPEEAAKLAEEVLKEPMGHPHT